MLKMEQEKQNTRSRSSYKDVDNARKILKICLLKKSRINCVLQLFAIKDEQLNVYDNDVVTQFPFVSLAAISHPNADGSMKS